ncbi:VacJ family lipoprotein [Luteibacter sp. 3190]|uniref:MlaA family lipoprotein n=1 Tax=Luteibacter sp. 3190 TaxID=2817736 RepID=UPI002866124F|nr:VacJ family lipoprotein [Luteibacter sp. 3190]MDR6937070.1 phospholipid-binding lipoprotein MlaA [Luteibacter sp. 3190]
MPAVRAVPPLPPRESVAGTLLVQAGRAGMILGALVVTGCAQQAKPSGDAGAVVAPANDEPINRKVFAFNRGVDKVVLKPVARGYSHLPSGVRRGVRHFVWNLQEPIVFANDLLQANFLRSLNTAGRFIVNSTVGVAGIFDVAGKWGMPHHGADLGQTFGVWGIGPGHTVELPLFGSSNVRDTVGRVLTAGLYKLGDNSDTVQTLETVRTVGGIVDGRAQALPLTDRLETSPDYYAALRDNAAARRAKLVEEGRRGDVHAEESPAESRAATGLPMNP